MPKPVGEYGSVPSEGIRSDSDIVKTWIEQGFNMEQALAGLTGPLIEVAGPTPSGYDVLGGVGLNENIHISNLAPEHPSFDGRTGKLEGFKKLEVDFVADATMLPFADNTVGAVFMSCLGSLPSGHELAPAPADRPDINPAKERQLWIGAITEAERVLKPHGLLIMQGAVNLVRFDDENFRFANSRSFKHVQTTRGAHGTTLVFEKTSRS